MSNNNTKPIVVIEKDDDGSYVAYYKESGDAILVGRGDTVNEAIDDFNNSIAESTEFYKSKGLDVPAVLTAKPVFKFDLSTLFCYYSMINVSKFAKFVGINPTLMRQYKAGNTYISERQLEKIETGIHKLGDEFSNLKLV
jgi:predicted RNase H-like HicB family nuclease